MTASPTTPMFAVAGSVVLMSRSSVRVASAT